MRLTIKVIVAIPTRNRPRYLRMTLKSVANQATKYGHDVEVVVSDTSNRRDARKRPYSLVNEKILRAIQKAYPKLKFHYYGPTLPLPIIQLLDPAGVEELHAYSALVPRDGHWGAHRNRLSLLAAYHGGRRAAYLHLDDDTPLLVYERGIRENPRDVIRDFLDALKYALKQKKPAASAAIYGVADEFVSKRHRGIGVADRKWRTRLAQALKRIPKFLLQTRSSGHRSAPGRIASYRALLQPYVPYGKNSDVRHCKDVFPIGGYASAEEACVLHVGISGPSFPDDLRKKARGRALVLRKKKIWASLVDRIARMGQQARRS